MSSLSDLVVVTQVVNGDVWCVVQALEEWRVCGYSLEIVLYNSLPSNPLPYLPHFLEEFDVSIVLWCQHLRVRCHILFVS